MIIRNSLFVLMLGVLLFAAPKLAAEEVADVPAIVVTADEEKYSDDPIEGVNRGIYEFNQTIDGAILEPAARGYRKFVHQYGRERIGSVLDTMNGPSNFINSVLQADVDNVFHSFWRFMINASFGIGGLFDVATQAGIPQIKKDFGQTLGKYGIGDGPYLEVPLLGPSNPRDLVGLVFDAVTNPFNYIGSPAVLTRNVIDKVDTREKLLDITDEIEETSFDPYATTRATYRQFREKRVNEAKARGLNMINFD